MSPTCHQYKKTSKIYVAERIILDSVSEIIFHKKDGNMTLAILDSEFQGHYYTNHILTFYIKFNAVYYIFRYRPCITGSKNFLIIDHDFLSKTFWQKLMHIRVDHLLPLRQVTDGYSDVGDFMMVTNISIILNIRHQHRCSRYINNLRMQ